MQELVCVRNGEAVVQTEKYCYVDSYDNFLLDGFEALPKGVTSFDFNKSMQTCIINDELQDDWQSEYGERVLAQAPVLREACEQRQQEQHAKEAAIELEAMIAKMSLAEYKEMRLKELTRASSAFENNLNQDMFFISALGFKCNGDRRTKANLQDLVTFFDLQAQNGTLAYRDYDNVNRDLTKEQLQLLLVEHVANGNQLYGQKWAYQEQINAAKSKDKLKQLEFTFTMADYSKAPLPSSVTPKLK